MLYDLLPNAPGNPNSLPPQKLGAHADDLVGMVSGMVTQSPRGKTSQPTMATTTPNHLTPLPSAKVNSMHTSQKPSGKNKKNKKKTSSSKEQSDHQNNPNQKNTAKNDKGNEKPMKFPCKICVKDHLTYKFPRLQECTDFIANKDSGKTPAILHNPFPNQ